MAQFLGIVAFCLSILSYQQNEHKKIVIFQFIMNICFMTHYYLLEAYTGAILNTIGVLRNVVFMFKEKRWAKSNLWIVFFSICCILAVAFTWDGIISFLPMTGMVLTTIAMGVNNPKLTRAFSLPSSPLWLVYNLINKSYGGVMTEVFNMTSIVIGMIRFDKKDKIEA